MLLFQDVKRIPISDRKSTPYAVSFDFLIIFFLIKQNKQNVLVFN